MKVDDSLFCEFENKKSIKGVLEGHFDWINGTEIEQIQPMCSYLFLRESAMHPTRSLPNTQARPTPTSPIDGAVSEESATQTSNKRPMVTESDDESLSANTHKHMRLKDKSNRQRVEFELMEKKLEELSKDEESEIHYLIDVVEEESKLVGYLPFSSLERMGITDPELAMEVMRKKNKEIKAFIGSGFTNKPCVYVAQLVLLQSVLEISKNRSTVDAMNWKVDAAEFAENVSTKDMETPLLGLTSELVNDYLFHPENRTILEREGFSFESVKGDDVTGAFCDLANKKLQETEDLSELRQLRHLLKVIVEVEHDSQGEAHFLQAVEKMKEMNFENMDVDQDLVLKKIEKWKKLRDLYKLIAVVFNDPSLKEEERLDIPALRAKLRPGSVNP